MNSNFEMFTRRAVNSIETAIDSASKLGHTYVGTEHMILGFLQEGGNVAASVLNEGNIKLEDVYDRMIMFIGKGEQTRLGYESFTPALCRVFNDSQALAEETGTRLVGTEHIFMTILKEKGCGAVTFLKAIGADTDILYRECRNIYAGEQKVGNYMFQRPDRNKLPSLYKYGVSLTDEALEKKHDPLIGRHKEISRVLQILSRRTKNNPCLIGEAGVGKTAIVEGLAELFVNGNVSDELKMKNIFSLDLSSMLAGAKYRGDFEERIKTCIAEASAFKNIILFIDEIHTIVGAGAAEGAIDAANIIKPQLARGELQIIGATTIEEYRKYIEKDAALERRFQPVVIEEPTAEQTINIISGLKEKYESYHNVVIPDNVIRSAVELSVRYINDRSLPDKAIDIIDEAASRAKIRNIMNCREKNISKSDNSEYKTLDDVAEKFDKNHKKKSRVSLTADDTAAVVSDWTGIPVSSISKSESIRLLTLEKTLKKSVIGQDKAVETIASAIRKSRTGLREPGRPIGAFLFTGPTGVGKTELSKAIAKAVFDSDKALIKIDMSEYMEKHTVSKLIGAPPGYAGFDECNPLTDRIRHHPYSVILFDEIEKAHPDVLNLMLQIIGDGILTDSNGRTICFKNTLIILTSNIGGEIMSESAHMGFGKNENSSKEKEVLAAVRKQLRPELINRLDDIIVFLPLKREHIVLIVMKLMNELHDRAANIGIDIGYSERVVEELINEEKIKRYGARYLKRSISDKIEDMLSTKLLDGTIQKGERTEIIIDKNGTFDICQPLQKGDVENKMSVS